MAETWRKFPTICDILHSTLSVITATASLNLNYYPIHCIAADFTNNVERTLASVHKSKKHSNALHQVFAITTSADFRKV
ncbi:unnamed protein product [Lupinus luteus]|uniref:DUF7792 domain-containing protein n=1 Tax=Lupinus luteus TaxID=3873 RepID=A0AAV1XUT4_LUPLU